MANKAINSNYYTTVVNNDLFCIPNSYICVSNTRATLVLCKVFQHRIIVCFASSVAIIICFKLYRLVGQTSASIVIRGI